MDEKNKGRKKLVRREKFNLNCSSLIKRWVRKRVEVIFVPLYLSMNKIHSLSSKNVQNSWWYGNEDEYNDHDTLPILHHVSITHQTFKFSSHFLLLLHTQFWWRKCSQKFLNFWNYSQERRKKIRFSKFNWGSVVMVYHVTWSVMLYRWWHDFTIPERTEKSSPHVIILVMNSVARILSPMGDKVYDSSLQNDSPSFSIHVSNPFILCIVSGHRFWIHLSPLSVISDHWILPQLVNQRQRIEKRKRRRKYREKERVTSEKWVLTNNLKEYRWNTGSFPFVVNLIEK